jgi:hypothetical protein
MVVGATGHIGCGWLDITDQRLDRDRLVIETGRAGRRARKVYIATGERTVERVAIHGIAASFDAAKGVCVVPLTVDERATIEVTFAAAPDA